jgi:chromosome segregation ATPase
MAYDINSALERLEKNLKDIDSARQQVEKTITSSNNLQTTISSFVKSLKSLHGEVENLITDLEKHQALKKSELEASVDNFQSSCESAISAFNNGIELSSSAFKTKMDETLSSLQRESTQLATQVKELVALKEILNGSTDATKDLESKLDTVSKEINQSLKNQEISLSSIKTNIENTKEQIRTIISILESNFAELNSDAKFIVENTNTIISKQAELKATCTKIESELVSTKEITETTLNNLSKDIKMNRMLIIIGVIILALLHFFK